MNFRLPAVFFIFSMLCSVLLAEETMVVSTDIDPNSSENIVNRANVPVLKVAIHSTSDFDASKAVDDTVLLLAGTPVMKGGWGGVDHALCNDVDVNNDGIFYLVCKFKTSDLKLEAGEHQVELEGKIYPGGERFIGRDKIILH